MPKSPFGSQRSPARSTPGPTCSEGRIGMQWVRRDGSHGLGKIDLGLSEAGDKFLTAKRGRGPDALPTAMRCGERTHERSPSLRLARVLTGPLLGLFRFSSGTLRIWDGQHEAHFERRGTIGDNCFAAALMAGAGVLLCRQVR
jgi:hypothetical protein